MNTDQKINDGLKKKIFLIDDNEDVIAVIKISLEMLGYDVVEFGLGRDAVEHFSAIGPSLVIIDQGLPDIEGLEVGRQIRNMETENRCPLILLTGNDSQPLRDRAKEIGIDDFLVKPARIQALAECIDKQLNNE